MYFLQKSLRNLLVCVCRYLSFSVFSVSVMYTGRRFGIWSDVDMDPRQSLEEVTWRRFIIYICYSICSQLKLECDMNLITEDSFPTVGLCCNHGLKLTFEGSLFKILVPFSLLSRQLWVPAFAACIGFPPWFCWAQFRLSNISCSLVQKYYP